MDVLFRFASGLNLCSRSSNHETGKDKTLHHSPDDLFFVRHALDRYPESLEKFCGGDSLLSYASKRGFERLARLAPSRKNMGLSADELTVGVLRGVIG